jgi:hypothetical protein
MIEEFLKTLEDTEMEERKTIEFVYDSLFDKVYEGQYELIDKLLDNADVTKMNVAAITAILSVTHMRLSKLPNRKKFLADARVHLTKTKPNEVDALLMGFDKF